MKKVDKQPERLEEKKRYSQSSKQKTRSRWRQAEKNDRTRTEKSLCLFQAELEKCLWNLYPG